MQTAAKERHNAVLSMHSYCRQTGGVAVGWQWGCSGVQRGCSGATVGSQQGCSGVVVGCAEQPGEAWSSVFHARVPRTGAGGAVGLL